MAEPAAASDSPFRSANTSGFADFLEQNRLCLLVSTYQAGKLMAIRGRQGRISTLLRTFDRIMGLAVRPPQIAVGTRYQVWFYRNAPDIAGKIEPAGVHDACFLPRTSVVTGDIRGHEMAWVGDELWIVNTFFSCLCTLHPDYSFVPRWRPPFVSALAAEDRCHLNGLAVSDGQIRYLTALGETDGPAGWRPSKADGGVVLEFPSGRVVARGLSMPHSPRLYSRRLWVLESGTGQLQIIEPATGVRQLIGQVPGFARGLAFWGPYAFIGLSKIRETAMFGGLPISAHGEELKCGVWVMDVRTGRTVELMQFEAGVEEIFAVEVLTGIRFPEIMGFQQDDIRGTFIIPP